MASNNASSPTPIAIVGMSCRLPGDVSTLESFWSLISRCRDGFGAIPADRLSDKSYLHPNPHKKGCYNQRGGYFLKQDVSTFDAPFFRVSKQEALAMDPQQRLLLECTYEAFENAGIPSQKIAGTNTGCFIAGNVSDYRYNTLRELNQVPMFEATGNHLAIQSGRVSHFFDMRGPCLVMDTACSSGLHALHVAVQSIRSGESTCAVVGASNLVLSPEDSVTMSMLGLFNTEGKTFAFDHRGKSGFARGEGAACLILKPLDQAIKDNDNIRSVIVNTGTGHDGNTIGLTTPSGEAQEQLIRDVYARANISPEDTGFVEAHGMGTKVGDPIEAGAIHRVFGAGRTKRAPLFMGSAKTNVGHAINVSGLVSIIKASMMLQNGFVLPNVNFEKANDAIPLAEWNITVPTSVQPWPESKRFVSVNNFGFGGSNSHAVLERYQAPPPVELTEELGRPRPRLMVLSANDEEAAKRAASQLGLYIEENPEVPNGSLMNNLAYTLGERRTHLSWRLAVTVSSGDELAAALNSAQPAFAEPSKVPKVAFVYTGQGAQWARMGLELMNSHPVFAGTVKAAARHLETLGADFSLLDELSKAKDESKIGQAHLSQPVCTAVQLGLGQVTVACENSPSSVTASGDADAVDRLAAELERRGLFNRKLQVGVAYHSAHMQLVADDYMAAINDVAPGPVRDAAFYSSLQGRKLGASQSLGPSYWVDNLTMPVLLASSLRELYLDVKPDVIVEVGPHSALEGPIKQILKGIDPQVASEVKYMPSLVRNHNGTAAALDLAAGLFCQGARVDFGAVNQTAPAHPTVLTQLAPYPWSKERHWFESRTSKQHRLLPFSRHDLLGLLESSYTEREPVWRNVISVDDVPWLKNHRMQSLATFPLTGFMSMTIEAASQKAQLQGAQAGDIAGFRFREVQASRAFILDDEGEYETRVSLKAQSEGTRSYSGDWDEFSISSWSSNQGWVEHCRGLIRVKKQSAVNPIREANQQAANARLQKATDPAGQDVSLEAFYKELEQHGAGYSSAFKIQPGNELRVNGDYATSTVDVPDTASSMSFSHETSSLLQPAFMDLTLHNAFAYLGAGRGQLPSLFMPTIIQEGEVSSALCSTPGDKFRVVSRALDYQGSGPVEFSLDTWHASLPEPVVKLSGVRLTPVDNGAGASVEEPRSMCYEVKWEPLGHGPEPSKNDSTNGHANGITNGIINGTNGHADGITTGHANGITNGVTNGTNGVHGANGANGKAHADETPVVLITDKGASDPLVSALGDLVEMRTGSQPIISPLSSVKIGEPSQARYVCLAELDAPLLHNMSAGTFEHLQKLLLACQSMLWVTRGAYRFAEDPMSNIAQGLLRTVRSETGKAAASLDLDPHSQLKAGDQAELVWTSLGASLAEHKDGSPTDYEFAEENGKLVVPRVVDQRDMNLAVARDTRPSVPYLQDFEQPARRLKVSVGTFGALDSLYWEDEPQKPLAETEIEIKVACTGMNFKDVVIAMGQVASPYLGVECSGTVARIGSGVSSLKVGDRVCAMSKGAYGTFARCPATSAAVIPDSLSFNVAASLPVVFCTAYYGLFDSARLEAGEKILIHAASGGVGQAAIQLAQSVGAEIFATVGSADKKKHIMETYGIRESHIFYSRDASFGPAIKEATGGKGVDVVINSLAGDLLRETWDCLAPFGRFVEIGKRDINSNTRLEMAKFEHNCTFSSVDLTHIAAGRPKIMSRVLAAVLDLLVDKTVKPIEPVTTVGIAEVETALRKLQSGQTSGKVVVDHSVAGKVKATHPPRSSILLHKQATYVIIGGTGGLGRSMARRMIRLGAGNIVLLSRSGKVTGELEQLMAEAQASGSSIHVKSCDVADESGVKALVSDMEKSMPPVRGVIHAAMVLKDMLFEGMKFDDYETVVRSKISGAWNMHNALIDRPLDFFVVLSSVAGIIGNRGQAAYAAANTFLDAFVRYRVRKGMAASSLDLAAVSDAGYLAENAAKQAEVLRNISGSAMDESEVLAVVEQAISGNVDTVCDNQCIFGLDFENPTSLPYYASDAKFAHLREAALAKVSCDEGSSTELPMAQRLRRAASVEEAEELVASGLRDKLSAILMRPIPTASAQIKSVAALGLDSLNAIELRNWIGRELQAHLQVLELLQSGGLEDLAKLVLKKSTLISA